MGWSFHKSINFGPFRINISKAGIGYSLGEMGFRIGRKATGSTYTSVSVPGTGARYQKNFPK